jgi:hypothetical protein
MGGTCSMNEGGGGGGEEHVKVIRRKARRPRCRWVDNIRMDL